MSAHRRSGLRLPQYRSVPLTTTGQDRKSLGGQPVYRPGRLQLLCEPGFRPPFFNAFPDRFGFYALAVRVEKRQFVTRRTKSLGQIPPRRRVRLARSLQHLRRPAAMRSRPPRDRTTRHDATLFTETNIFPQPGLFGPFFTSHCGSLTLEYRPGKRVGRQHKAVTFQNRILRPTVVGKRVQKRDVLAERGNATYLACFDRILVIRSLPAGLLNAYSICRRLSDREEWCVGTGAEGR